MTETNGNLDGVLAEYAQNPFINRLPPEPEPADIKAALDKPPLYSPTDRQLRPGQRRHCVMRLAEYSQPTDPALQFGLMLDLIIKRGYVGRNPLTTNYVRGMERVVSFEEAIINGSDWHELDLASDFDTSLSMAALGMPGGGKTHTVKRICARYSQIVKHTAPFLLHQIVWLRVECPPGGSPKSLCEFFFQEVDSVLRKNGVSSRYHSQYKGKTLDGMMAGMARVATLHAIGVLIVDEIQNVKRAKQDVNASVLNFLVTMRNSIGIPIVMVGTMAAQNLLRRTFHDARRADGLGSIYFERLPPGPNKDRPFSPEFRTFVKKMWKWQWTKDFTEIDDKILKAIYLETQGVIDLIVKLFILVQLRLISAGSARGLPEIITPEIIHDVAKDRFRVVEPYVKALRENDELKLIEFEDLIDFRRAFENHIQGIGTGFHDPVLNESHGLKSIEPTPLVNGMADESTYDILLAGQGIPADRREWIITKAKELSVGTDISDLMLAMSQAIAIDRELNAPTKKTKPKPKAPKPVEGDIRENSKNGESDQEVYDRLLVSGHIGFAED